MTKRKTALENKGLHSSEQIVQRYFHFITEKDVAGLLDLFAYDAVVYEPFSNVAGGLKGKAAIEYFLKVAVMANSGLDRTIELADKTPNSITALVTFRRGSSVTGKFAFSFIMEDSEKKIKTLRIRFNGT